MVKCDVCAISRLKTATISTVCHYSMLVTLHKICRVYLDLLERNGFLFLKAKNETFSPARVSRGDWSPLLTLVLRAGLVVGTINMKINLTSSSGRLRQKVAPKNVPHVQHEFSLFNQSCHRYAGLSLSLPSSFLQLPIERFHSRDQ